MEMQAHTQRRFVPTAEPQPYAAIGDYALIGDCRAAALVSTRGSIDWLCMPQFSSSSVFAALLDHKRGGCFSVCPTEPFRSERRYGDGTPVLETRFHTETGVVQLTDLMPILADERNSRHLHPQRELLRRVEALEGDVEIEVRYIPRPDYARRMPDLQRRGVLGWAFTDAKALYLLHTDVPLEPSANGTELRGRLRLRRGERRYLSLTYVSSDIAVVAPLGREADTRIEETLDWWRNWSRRCTYQGRYRASVVRSAVTLKLLTYVLSGAVVAAPTTSLPEAIGGERNWDYRYCWLRDASLTMSALMDLGCHAEGEAFFGWLLNATRLTRPRLQVLYDVYGETRIPERVLEHLEGYRGSRPVRIGNGADRQLQLDAYGSVVLAAYDYIERDGGIGRDEARFLCQLGETVCREWRLPDHGIWEIRGAPRHHTYSKLMCWVALDRLLKLHEHGKLRVPVERFRAERDAIAQAIEARGYNHELGGYSGFFDAAVPDASLLLMARYGFRPAQDARVRATFECIERELGRGPLLYRLPPGADRLPSREGAFLIASFWSVDYLVRCGETERARERFEHLLAIANDLGLYGEEADPETNAALGNFPQAFSHVGLLAAAFCLADAEAGAKGGAA